MTSAEFKQFIQQYIPLSSPTLRSLGMMALVNGRLGKDIQLQDVPAPANSLNAAVAPLGLPYSAAVHLPPKLSTSASQLVARILEYVRDLDSQKPIALLDSGFHGEFLRRHLMSHLEGRCDYHNYMFHLIRGNGPEQNFIDYDYSCFVALSHPAVYHRMTRYVTQHSRRPAPMVLPFARGPASLTRASLGPPGPIVVAQFPGAGTQRMRPVWEAIMAALERPKVEFNEPFFNRRFIEQIDPQGRVAPLTYGRDAIAWDEVEGYYANQISTMDQFQWLQFHHPVRTAWLATLSDCRVVYLYRDPRDILTSWYHLLTYDGDRTDFADFQSLPPEEAFLRLCHGFDYIHSARGYFCKVPSLEVMAQNFAAIQQHPNMYGLRFEDIRYRPEEAYADVLRWLGLDSLAFVSSPAQVIAAHVAKGTFKAQSGGKVSEGQEQAKKVYRPAGKMMTHSLRKGVAGDWKNYFTPTVKKKVKDMAGEALVALGYEKDLDW